MTFLFIVVGRCCEDQVRGCLDSIAGQKGDHDYRVAVVDDASTDRTGEAVKNFCDRREGWSWTVNDVRVGAMANQFRAWNSFDAEPDDIAIWVDLDDKLAHADVLNVLALRYAETDALVTYGSYKSEPFSSTCPPARAYPVEVAEKRAFRQWMREGRGIWHNHLRSMRWSVLARITEADCRDDNGDWWMTGPDMATMLPALEIAGPRAVFLSDVLYCYTSSLDSAEWRQVPDVVRANHQAMFAREPKVPVLPLSRPRDHVQARVVRERERATAARNARLRRR